ncbi:MAG: hypothetical protein KF852_03095 [Saprospiraceae bacterium]|nr:hypothetical protein [Saprospiraceae bacterium]
MPTNNIILTETEKDDLNAFFEFQLDKEAIHLAAFTPKDPSDKAGYMEKFTKLLSDPTINTFINFQRDWHCACYLAIFKQGITSIGHLYRPAV